MLKLSDLARRPDLRLGPLLVSPSRRLIQGPGGEAHLEPLTMQVLLLLLDSGGKVVTRAELFEQCWGGGIAGDDSLNQAVAKLRRTAAQVAPGLFEIETIPRTGYRLTGELAAFLADQPDSAGRSGLPRRMSRRALVVSAAAGAGIVAGGLGLGALLSKDGGEFDALMKRGEEELDFGDPARPAAPYFEQAAALREDSAKAQGLLAYSHALAAEYGSPGAAGVGVLAAERAARTALTLDPAQPDALLANVLLQRSTMDLATTEDRLRAILRDDPRNIRVMRQLWHVLHNAGRCRDSLAAVERALAVRPLAAANNFPRAQLLWVLGRNAEADRVIDRAMQYWPTHRWVRFARFMIFAFTDRPRAALAMIDDPATRPQHYTPEAVALWRVSLAALDQREPAAVAAARDANLAAAERNLSLAPQAILTLSGLGELDSAFEVANGVLVFDRPVARRPGTGSVGPPITSMSWRFAPWMFTPATAPMRADPRFQALCEGIGLTDYWNKRGIKPDYQLGIV